MKISIIGATGFIGTVLVSEALRRNHQVTAIARNTSKLSKQTGLACHNADIFEQDRLASLIVGSDVVISAFTSFHSGLPIEQAKLSHIDGIKTIIAAVKKANTPRLLVVGGAGSLKVASGQDLVDTADFPAEWKDNAIATRDALHLLQHENDLDWSFLSPSALIQPGERTGQFRLGRDELLVDQQGESHISLQDYAVAMLDEAENPKHPRMRFTVGY